MYLLGTFAGLIAVIVVATLFITAEYRRGLIRTTLAASPRRGRVLAAKAIVIGAVTFVAGLAAAAVAVAARRGRILRANGNYVFPVTWLTELRVIVGTAALLAVAAVLALALGTVLRRSAAAVTTGIVVIVLPYILASPPPCRAASGLAAAAHPGRRVRRPADPAAYPQVTATLHARHRLLPAGPVGRPRRAVRLRRARAGPGRSCCAGGTHERRACTPSGPSCAPLRRTGLAAARRRRADRGGQRRGAARPSDARPVPAVPGDTTKLSLTGDLPRPGGRRSSPCWPSAASTAPA